MAKKGKGKVAVVDIHGVIGSGVGEVGLSRTIANVGNSNRYGALVLDIDSPGGSATASDSLYNTIRVVSGKKPVVAYIRGLGASGGYYAACGAGRIMTLPTALVGSIGVIYIRPVLEQLIAKVGVEVAVWKGGEYKDLSAYWRKPTDDESGKISSLVETMYSNFVDVVASNRNMTHERAQALATGEVFTGKQAHTSGLVDFLGGFDNAVNLAAEMAGIKPRSKVVRPPRTMAEKFFGRRGAVQMESLGLTGGMGMLVSGGLYYYTPGLGT